MSLQSTDRPSSASLTSTAWLVLLGWTVVRLVTLGGRPQPAGIRARQATPDDRGAKQASGFGARTEAPIDQVRDDGRGRHADSPTEIPAKGWKDILWRVYERIQHDRILLVAAGVTFYALLAIFPAITALVSIYGLFTDPVTIQDHLSTLAGFLPSGALEVIGDQVKRIASKGAGTLSVSFLISLAVALWSANAGMKSIFDALNIVYEEVEKRSFIMLNVVSLTFTLGAIIFLLTAMSAVVVLPIVLGYVGLGSSAETLVSFLRWPALLIGIMFGLALIYRYGPSRDNPKWRWITPGSLLASVLWLAVSMLFSWYVSNFGSYNETYGSLGAVIGFMTWIWISTIIILVGTEINAEMEHQTVKDSTEGPSQPLGTRGATMADTVGEAKA
ncbi:YihY/virulence factor BrkB family protein [Microvirga puerhi]|uniref:YihY/virulence factor BrkB family protein n=1 Tax=Microvirga puerhi TaxID=2876078 RepID=A0ABS7VKK4_9HYPH|nr:YihY/virulence factor BrkB family protein [Microvirga puerhi]MBZ6076068.1 YihY/virulence factor BrkB family protein [Microvirga puerhi]